MKPLLLASNPPPFAGKGDAPRWDVAELARVLGADISYPPPNCGTMGRIAGALEEKIASDMRQAWEAFRKRNETGVYVSLSEKAGLPLALLARGRGWGKRGRVPHVLIAHHLTSSRKRALHARTGCLHLFDRIVVLCRTQADYLTGEANVSPDKVRFVYDKVDHHFWMPIIKTDGGQNGPIVAVGRERRDYQTLADAVRLVPDRKAVVVASSPWARQNQSGSDGDAPPPNMAFRGGLSFEELRELIRRASVVVVPLQAGTNYAAGVNAVLEAMACGKPLIVTQTSGIADYAQDNHNCRLVPPGDPPALQAALCALHQNPHEAARLGETARQTVESGRTLEAYVEAVRRVVGEVAPC